MNNRRDGLRKAAIVLSTLGAEDRTLFRDVMEHFNEVAREGLIREIGLGRATQVDPDERAKVLQDFYEIMERQAIYGDTVNPLELISDLLPSGSDKRKSEMLSSILKTGRFSFLRDLSADEIYNAIRAEHPQTIALILFFLTAEKSAEVFNKITQSDIRSDIARRIAEISDISDDTLDDVEGTLKERLSVNSGKFKAEKSGAETLAQMIVRMDSTAQSEILDKLEKNNPSKAQEVRDNLFTFEDILYIDDGDMRSTVLKEIDYTNELPKALKGASEALREKFEKNLGKNQWEEVVFEMDLIGGIPFSQVDEARRSIVDKIRTLESTGQLVISRDYREEEIVE